MNYQQIGLDHKTNVELAEVIETVIREHVWPIVGNNVGVSPYLVVVPGLKAGTVKLNLSDDSESPDVIQVAAKMTDATAPKVIAAEMERLRVREFASDTEMQQRSAEQGFKLGLSRDDDGLHFKVTRKRNVKGSALAWTKAMNEIKALLSFIGETTEVNVHYGDKDAPKAKDETRVAGTEKDWEKLVQSMKDTWTAETLLKVGEKLTDHARTILLSEELLDSAKKQLESQEVPVPAN